MFTIFCMSMLSKVVICGSRSFTDWYVFYLKVDPMLRSLGLGNIEIVTGMAVGPDLNAADYAKINNMQLKMFPAQWDLYGRSAGFRRNADMMRYCLDTPDRRLIAFWDGVSHGTKHMLDICSRNDFKITVFPVK